jgi:hypothetical protein
MLACRFMLSATLAPVSATPLLHLGLAKIARTPRPRLNIGYRVIYRPELCLPRLSLGEKLAIDRILVGGTVGEALPLANLHIECERRGMLVDLIA